MDPILDTIDESKQGVILPDTTFDNIVLPSEQVEDEDAKLTPDELLAAYKALKATSKDPVIDPAAPANENFAEVLTEKYKTNNGVFTEQDYTELAAKGYTKEFIDTYISGAKAAEQVKIEAMISEVGTIEDYSAALLYASTAWNKDQIDTFNGALDGANDATTKMLITMLVKEYKGATAAPAAPNAPITTTTSPRASGNVTGYESKSDMTKDINDSRYQSDSAYREKVNQKMYLTDMSAWNHNPKGI
ncbi:MAG: hypothetical protein JHC33_07700 [Ignisphaera sp.]|nr:hypothetical protein [Ignisphaera sp.]